ncbi:arachidonate 5-lipoxygenase-like [Amblyraja radiata]|uniref:arachidonate 5-lipoxygenase-like n=1 Tax=Amblyraja radiata TaxID=386614 RepID=UPI001402766D|nr:arachidonate 5-lipoxygenase-like [Amblyraja radiata]
MKVTYQVAISTGNVFYAGTKDQISVMLVGSLGSSEKVRIGNVFPLTPGEIHSMKLKTKSELGDLLLVKLFKKKFVVFEDDWYCSFVSVETTNELTYNFPCYSWITDSTPMVIVEGAARKRHEYNSPILEQFWVDEMQKRQEDYQWAEYEPGVPNKIHYEKTEDLPRDAKIPVGRPMGFILCIFEGILKLALGEERPSATKIAHITPIKNYVMEHWHEDWCFGYQFLNGVDPTLIKQCKEIPEKFPVTEQMVGPFLGPNTSLQQEVQKGNIYLVDYEMLDGIKANPKAGHDYLEAPMCLLYVNPMNDLLPIAIQITQKPGPIFLPSDSQYDWLLAKMWVRNADVQNHQLVSHLLRTHLFGEVFSIATLRCLASAHPIFKLLMPHVKYTLHINTAARSSLISEGGVFDLAFSSGGTAIKKVLQRGLERTTYKSMCLPDNLAARGVEKIPNYYFRDDAQKIWLAINKFTENIVDLYYENDASVQSDAELQAWVEEIYIKGLLENPLSGFPSSFHSHRLNSSSPNHGPLHLYRTALFSKRWTARGGAPLQKTAPSIMMKPAPTEKGKVTQEDIEILCQGASERWTVNTTMFCAQSNQLTRTPSWARTRKSASLSQRRQHTS